MDVFPAAPTCFRSLRALARPRRHRILLQAHMFLRQLNFFPDSCAPVQRVQSGASLSPSLHGSIAGASKIGGGHQVCWSSCDALSGSAVGIRPLADRRELADTDRFPLYMSLLRARAARSLPIPSPLTPLNSSYSQSIPLFPSGPRSSIFTYPRAQSHTFIMSQKPVLVETASLHGKVALITGAGRGIGRGCAIELGKRGASVVVNYANSKSAADEVCKIIESAGTGAKSISIQADVSKKSEIERLFQETKKHFGKIDIVMSNSGTESWDKTEEITEEKYDHVFNLNARAQFFVGQAAWKYLENNGRLILMSSIAAGLLGVKDHVLYNASKMAVIGMIKGFATDFGVRGITVNGVAPGGIKSDMFTQNAWHYIPGATPDWPADKIEGMMAEHCPLKRCATPEDVARVVAFLASEDGGWVNGQVITISGGSSQ